MSPRPRRTVHRPRRRARHASLVVVAFAVMSACSDGGAVGGDGAADAAGTSAAAPDETPSATLAPVTLPPAAPAPTSAAPTTASTSTSTTVPTCTVSVAAGDSLIAIAGRHGITLEELQAENLIDPTDTIHPGQVFDVCVGIDHDDVAAAVAAPAPEAAVRQQEELNELFAGTSMLPLEVDGDSGKYTRQAACAARLGLGLPVHNGHLVAGSEEESAIFAATGLGIPEGAPTDADRWILIDQRCQVIVTGERDERVVDVFPTSTGEQGHETFTVRARAFRFDPAIANGGWHDSTSYPVAVDNPLNGNMYKPIYFNDGQAIHGAGYVPPEPRSKGCARTFPAHQDRILEWLGLTNATEATWNVDEIGVTVAVQGRYVDPTAE